MAIKPQQPIGSKPENSVTVIDQVTNSLRATAEEVVPWFLNQMPLMYFQDTSEEEQLAHLRAMIAAKASGKPIELTLRSEDSSQWTMMRPRDYPGVLAEIMEELPWDQTLRTAKIHTATDGELVLDTFEFGEPTPFAIDDPDHTDRLNEMIAYADQHMQAITADEVRSYFARSSEEYIMTVTPLRMAKHWQLVESLSGTDGTMVELETETDPTLSRIIVAVSNSTRRSMLQRIATRLSKSRVNIHRAYLDSVDDGNNGWITLVGCVVQGPEGGPIDPSSDLWQEIRQDLLRLKWYDHRTLELGYEHPDIGLRKAEIITALIDLSYQILVKKNPYAFNPTQLHSLMTGNLEVAASIADLFHQRFDPDNLMSDDAYETARATIRETIENTVDLEDARTLFETMLRAVNAVKRTNLFLEDRYALSMRIDASILTTDCRSDCPFGAFFIHGRDFIGFHVRFNNVFTTKRTTLRLLSN